MNQNYPNLNNQNDDNNSNTEEAEEEESQEEEIEEITEEEEEASPKENIINNIKKIAKEEEDEASPRNNNNEVTEEEEEDEDYSKNNQINNKKKIIEEEEDDASPKKNQINNIKKITEEEEEDDDDDDASPKNNNKEIVDVEEEYEASPRNNIRKLTEIEEEEASPRDVNKGTIEGDEDFNRNINKETIEEGDDASPINNKKEIIEEEDDASPCSRNNKKEIIKKERNVVFPRHRNKIQEIIKEEDDASPRNNIQELTKEEEDEASPRNNIKENNITNENIFIISLDLIRKFKEIKQNICYSDSIIIEYISKTGLPMHFPNKDFLSLYLYFHKICSSFYIIFEKISSKEISNLILSLLRQSYYILADEQIQHFNYNNIAQKIFPNLHLSQENSDISNIPIILNENFSTNFESTRNFEINKLILELGFRSNGRLDVYTKIHTIKSIVKYIKNKELLVYIKIFNQMENDLMNLYINSQKEKLDFDIYEHMVNIFVNGEMQEKWDEYLNHCRKLIGVFQNVRDLQSLKILGKLFI